MTDTRKRVERPDYGIDAPHVIRNLVAIGFILLGLGFLFRHGIRVAGGKVVLQFGPMFLTIALACFAEAVLMVVYAKSGKFAHRDRMLAMHQWRGDERVLDIGTGRGLMLVGAARRLQTGSAVGIDIWRTEDLTGNNAAATQRNLGLEGVARHCKILSMPAQAMTFADGSFDVVVSNLCLHNMDAWADRDAACREIVRVLKPGGTALISDFKNTGEYAKAFQAAGCDVHRTNIDLRVFPPLRVVVAVKGAT